MSEVVLRYRRERDHSSGSIFLRDGEKTEVRCEFKHWDFKSMMTHFAKVLVEHHEASAVVERIDRSGLLPFVLPDMLAGLLREDPAEAIRQLTPPAVVVDLREEKKKDEDPKGLRVGYDAVADAFGDEIYCRAREEKIECPVCGSWGRVENGSLQCLFCHVLIRATSAGPKWWTVVTCELLYTKTTEAHRYFIPRAWNPTPPWIEAKDLEEKYQRYLKEKHNV